MISATRITLSLSKNMIGRGWAFIPVFLVLLSCTVGHSKEVTPGDDYCREINDPASGDEVALMPGEYRGPCKIRRSGIDGRPLVIRAADMSSRPRISYGGQESNVFEIYANHVVVRGLDFGPTRRNVDGVRVISGNGVIIEDCNFHGMGGIAIVANHDSIVGLVVRRNVVTNSSATAMYFGCHDGVSCAVTDLLIEQNFIQGVSAPETEVGYGMQVKLNSHGIIRDNVITDTKGPGIMIYGATDKRKIGIVERNFASGSRNSSGIVVGGGPAVVRNNITQSNEEAGISLQDYGQRALLKGVVVTHNTVYNNNVGGIVVRGNGGMEAEIAHNAISVWEGTVAFTNGNQRVKVSENVDCSKVKCFVNPEKMDFSPVKGSPLLALAREHKATSVNVTDDYFRKPRGPRSAVGAIEPPGGAVSLGIKP